IYSGQEYDMSHRLKFFEKDTIPKTKGEVWPVLVKLGDLKNNSTALHGGKNAADYERITTSANEKVLAFKRGKHGEEVIFVANMTKAPVKFTMDVTGNYEDYFGSETIPI